MKFQRLAFIACLVIPLISVAQTKVTNQRVFDTIGFLPEYYPQRVAVFEKEPVVTGRIIFLGNSITQLGIGKNY